MKPAIQPGFTSADFEEAEIAWACGVLAKAAERFLTGREFSEQTIEAVRVMTELHTREARAQGIRFPDMQVIGIASVRSIQICRKDLEGDEVDRWVLKLIRENPTITKDVVRAVVATGWPDHRLDFDDPKWHPENREPLRRPF